MIAFPSMEWNLAIWNLSLATGHSWPLFVLQVMQESLHAGVISEGRRKAAAVAEERFKEQVARERGLLRVKKARSWGHKL